MWESSWSSCWAHPSTGTEQVRKPARDEEEQSWLWCLSSTGPSRRAGYTFPLAQQPKPNPQQIQTKINLRHRTQMQWFAGCSTKISGILPTQTPSHYLPGALRAKERMNSSALFPSVCRSSPAPEQSLFIHQVPLLRLWSPQGSLWACPTQGGEAAAPLPFCHYTTALQQLFMQPGAPTCLHYL